MNVFLKYLFALHDNTKFNQLSFTLYTVPIFPFFDACHFIMMSIAVREDAHQSGAMAFSRVQPMLCYVASIAMCFAGNCFASSLLGESIIMPLTDKGQLFVASVCWYLVNFSYGDTVYEICCTLHMRLLICLLKELQRTYKIYSGVRKAALQFPEAYLIWILIGMIKGAGSYHMRAIIKLFITTDDFNRQNFMSKLPPSSKICSWVASLFTLHFAIFGVHSKPERIYLISTIFLVYYRTTDILFSIKDPFAYFEKNISKMLFGDPEATLNHFISVRSTMQEIRTKSFMSK